MLYSICTLALTWLPVGPTALGDAIVQDPRCPHMGVEVVRWSLETSVYINCHTNQRVTSPPRLIGGGDRVRLGSALCPLISIYTPTHQKPVPTPGFKLAGKTIVFEKIIKMQCHQNWFLFFPIGHPYCVHVGESVGPPIDSWSADLCDVVKAPPTGGDR